MNSKNILKVIGDDGKTKEIEIMLYFTLETNNKDYVIYKELENDNKDMLYSSEVVKANGDTLLKEITEQKIIEEIKSIISEVENG